ncbi:magnesium transporter [Stella humosa]|uniref:Magnesium transporter MgtE n=1 Tax=Stella humosa TaxID=94 RepID=A0A3N1MA49_9PROT|nr:magnesium transporter [Stella humosa]ROQ00508.1 magnesium transporter [Stella humosa]BBK30248.1 magnesium transporter MgtE [Stella humosa]
MADASDVEGGRRTTPASLYGLTPRLMAALAEALAADRDSHVRAFVRPLHPADLADLIERLDEDDRQRLVRAIRDVFDPECLPWLEDSVREDVMDQLGMERVAEAVAELETDDAVEVLESLDALEQREVLRHIPAADRAVLEQGLTYPEDSAGRLMQRELVAVPPHWTVGQTIDFLRSAADLPDHFFDVFVIDPRHKAVGVVPVSRILRTKRPVRITDIMDRQFRRIPATADQEEVGRLFKQYGLASAPVVDDDNRLVGVITVDDAVHVLEEEAEEDLMSLGRVGGTNVNASVMDTARTRIRWLLVTLVNTLIASTVISQFEATIERIVALAVLMPIVAAMGGNAGMQVVTVVVRALATRDLAPDNVRRVVLKELGVGVLNGVVFASILGTVAGLWFADVRIGLVLAAAMVFNMVWAGLAGAMIPILIQRMKIDPAVGAGPFLTTTTDVLGFFSFLGLATLFLI